MRRGALRVICAIFLCLAMPLWALGEALEIGDPITGVQTYPEGATEQDAGYVFRYAFPQFQAVTEADKAINAYYAAMCDDLRAVLAIGAVIETVAPSGEKPPTQFTDIQYQVTAVTDAYVSVTLTQKQFMGYVESETLSANVFARDGLYAGQPVSLSQVMGMEQEQGADQKSYAAELVYKLVWRIVEEQKASLEKDYFDDLTQKDLEAVFSPETDFYIDLDGNLVFYVQAGVIAGDVEGILTYPFSMAELLTAVKE